MNTIIVDDDPKMLMDFRVISNGIESIKVIGEFLSPTEALECADCSEIELAVLDVAMPGMTGIELAEKLKAKRPDMMIVFISAFNGYIRQSNEVGADYYIVKPYTRETIEQMAERMVLLSRRLKKSVYVQTFGRFLVRKNNRPVQITGKAKEILALIVTRRGKEISNEEIYSTIWEGRPYGNVEMKVYYNALKRLKDSLEAEGLRDLLISTSRGQTVNTELFDCDYYAWQDKAPDERDKFSGEFMSEFSWGEPILADILDSEYED